MQSDMSPGACVLLHGNQTSAGPARLQLSPTQWPLPSHQEKKSLCLLLLFCPFEPSGPSGHQRPPMVGDEKLGVSFREANVTCLKSRGAGGAVQ